MIARAVDRLDPEGRARRSARAIVLRGHVDDDRLARLRLIEPVDRNARDEAGRQVEQHVDHAFEPQPGQRLGELRPDALEVGQRGQERVEDFGSHRSEEHTSELQSLMRISYDVFTLKKKTHKLPKKQNTQL